MNNIPERFGFKGMTGDMKSFLPNKFQFELGETYEIPGGKRTEPVELGFKYLCSGFYFDFSPAGVLIYYPHDIPKAPARYFLIEYDDLEIENCKCVTNKIRIIEEIPTEIFLALDREIRRSIDLEVPGEVTFAYHDSGYSQEFLSRTMTEVSMLLQRLTNQSAQSAALRSEYPTEVL